MVGESKGIVRRGRRKFLLTEFDKAWGGLKSRTRFAFTGKFDQHLTPQDVIKLKKYITDCVSGKGGKVAQRHAAVELGMLYLDLSVKGQKKFFKILADDFDIDQSLLAKNLDEVRDADCEGARIDAEVKLKQLLTPPRMELLRQFNSLPQGLKFLINMRADLLPYKKDNPRMKKLELEFKELLAAWFDVGLLDLSEITWSSSAALLEKLIKYEAVHEIKSWADMRGRLVSDRRCFAFFHHKIETVPLIFVEVALVNDLPSNIQNLLAHSDEDVDTNKASTAIFYSISNTQKGLGGISMGNFLIKRVVEKLSVELKGLKSFATLSPLPTFRRWLDKKLSEEDVDLQKIINGKLPEYLASSKKPAEELLKLLGGDWQADEVMCDKLEPLMTHLVALYLMKERRLGKAFDPVANFHLTNGARIQRINFLGDISEHGMKQSYGMMVNYRYKLHDIEENHEAYVTSCHIATSKDVRSNLKLK